MITIDNKTYRNLQEQVQKNKEDIAAFKSVDQILIDFGIKVLGQVKNAEQIPEGAYEYGDAYLVGTVDPYDIYIYTRGEVAGFVNLGPLAVKGPQGDQGPQGPQGEQGKRGSTIYSNVGSPTEHNYAAVEGDIYIRTDDASPNNKTAGYIYQYSGDDWHYKTTLRGPQGIQGPTGPHGPRGYTGNVGPQGPAGDPGQSFLIQATLNDPALLPDASQTQRNHAYVVKTSNYNRLYFIEGDNTLDNSTLIWNYVDMGNVGSIVTEDGQAVQEYNADKAKLRAVQFYNPNSVFKDDELGGYAVVGGGYIETVDGQYSYSLDDTTVVLPLDDTSDITWSADQSGTKLQAHLADAVTDKLDSALVKPTSAPTKTKFVGVDTSNTEILIDADNYVTKTTLEDTNEITWSTAQSGAKLQAHLADAVTNKLNSTLVKPASAPSQTSLVGVDTSNSQTMIPISTITNKLDRALVTPTSAPAETNLVAINTSNSQTMIPVSTVKTATNGACVPPASAFRSSTSPGASDYSFGGGTVSWKVRNFYYFVGPDSISFTGRIVIQITSKTGTPIIYVRFNDNYLTNLSTSVNLCLLPVFCTGSNSNPNAPLLLKQALLQKYNNNTLLINLYTLSTVDSNYLYEVDIPLITIPRN